MQVTISINEQTVTKILQALGQILQPVSSTATETVQAQPGEIPAQQGMIQPQLEALQKANSALWNRVQALQKEISIMRTQLATPQSSCMAEPGHAIQAHSEVGHATELPQQPEASTVAAIQPVQAFCQSREQAQTRPEIGKSEASDKAKPVQQPDQEKVERWTREHMKEWLDKPCPFKKAEGRTWRQMAENQGEKILVNGRPSLPRSYLHALEGWEDCKVWQKMKVKVALEVGEQSRANHLAAISE